MDEAAKNEIEYFVKEIEKMSKNTEYWAQCISELRAHKLLFAKLKEKLSEEAKATGDSDLLPDKTAQLVISANKSTQTEADTPTSRGSSTKEIFSSSKRTTLADINQLANWIEGSGGEIEGLNNNFVAGIAEAGRLSPAKKQGGITVYKYRELESSDANAVAQVEIILEVKSLVNITTECFQKHSAKWLCIPTNSKRIVAGKATILLENGWKVTGNWGYILETDGWGVQHQCLVSRTDTKRIRDGNEPDKIDYQDGKVFYGIISSSHRVPFFGLFGVILPESDPVPKNLLEISKCYFDDRTEQNTGVLEINRQDRCWEGEELV